MAEVFEAKRLDQPEATKSVTRRKRQTGTVISISCRQNEVQIVLMREAQLGSGSLPVGRSTTDLRTYRSVLDCR